MAKIDLELLDKLIEENKVKQYFKLDEFNKEMVSKWDDDKYYFDVAESEKIHKYISLLKNDKGISRKFTILKYQFEIIAEILCVKRRSDNLRRFREAHTNIPRKAGKSFIISIIMSYLFFYQKDIFGAIFIITGNTTKQATELFNTFASFVKGNKALKRKCKITESRKEIKRIDNNNKLMVLSNDGKNGDSYSVFVATLDEIHEYRDTSIYTKLKTGQGQWKEPLMITITTASSGANPENLEFQLYNTAKAYETGEAEEDETFYYKIYEAEANCEVDDCYEIVRVNPAIDIFRSKEDIISMCNRIDAMPSLEAGYRRLFLNQHIISKDEKGAIDMELFNKACKDVNIEDFKGMKCYGGLDLSCTKDITAFILIFYNEETDKYYVFPYLFTPKDTIEEREHEENWNISDYVRRNELIALDGKYVKFDKVMDKILELHEEYDIQQVAFDRFASNSIQYILEEQSFESMPIGQGTVTMSPIINTFEQLLVDDRIVFSKNNLMKYMASNCIKVTDDNLNAKYSRKKSKFKIDGIIAMLMALGIATTEHETDSYDSISALEKMSKMW